MITRRPESTYVMVVPALDELRTQRMLNSLRVPHENVIVVDNSPDGIDLPWEPLAIERHPENIGVAASWNVGARRVLTENRDYLIMCSTSLVFGPRGGLDFLEQLGESVWGQECVDIGWHLIAFGKRTLEATGLFDENFWPAYYEDTDFLYRMHLAGLPSPRENGRRISRQMRCEVANEGFALHIHTPGVNLLRCSDYYGAKWGDQQGSETFTQPFNDPTKDHMWWPEPPDERSILLQAREMT